MGRKSINQANGREKDKMFWRAVSRFFEHGPKRWSIQKKKNEKNQKTFQKGVAISMEWVYNESEF